MFNLSCALEECHNVEFGEWKIVKINSSIILLHKNILITLNKVYMEK